MAFHRVQLLPDLVIVRLDELSEDRSEDRNVTAEQVRPRRNRPHDSAADRHSKDELFHGGGTFHDSMNSRSRRRVRNLVRCSTAHPRPRWRRMASA